MFLSLVVLVTAFAIEVDESKIAHWQDFLSANRVMHDSVPLFAIEDGYVKTMPYGRDGRLVLSRSDEMDAKMRKLGRALVTAHESGQVEHSGILYMMFMHEEDAIIPLYIGKAEIYGKGDKNLSANISDLVSGNGKFGRWGYNYAYHIGDLSAVTLPGHAEAKRTIKYESWKNSLFDVGDGKVKPKNEIRFWACLWGPDRQSVWKEYGATRLAFEEYLLIGVASDVFPDRLLNREGRNR